MSKSLRSFRLIVVGLVLLATSALANVSLIGTGTGGVALSGELQRLTEQAAQPLPFTTIERGVFSSFPSRADLVLQDERTWCAFWEQHMRGRFRPPPCPAVDFQQEMVLAVVLGPLADTGPSIEIKEITANAALGLQVRVIDDWRSGPIVLPVVNTPFHIVKLQKVTGSIAFLHEQLPAIHTPRTLRVPQDFPTIQAALDAAREGDIVKVAAGTYKENLTITKSLSLIGEGRDRVTIEAADPNQAVIHIVSNGEVTLSDLTVTGNTRGLVINGSSQAAITQASFAETDVAVEAKDAASVWLIESVISKSRGLLGCSRAILLSGSARVSLADSTISIVQRCERVSPGTILVGDKATLHVQSSSISHRGGSSGIVVTEQARAIVFNSQIFKQDGDGITVNGTADIRENVIKDNGGCGVRAEPTAKITGSNNEISGNKAGDLCPPDFPWPPGFRK